MPYILLYRYFGAFGIVYGWGRFTFQGPSVEKLKVLLWIRTPLSGRITDAGSILLHRTQTLRPENLPVTCQALTRRRNRPCGGPPCGAGYELWISVGGLSASCETQAARLLNLTTTTMMDHTADDGDGMVMVIIKMKKTIIGMDDDEIPVVAGRLQHT